MSAGKCLGMGGLAVERSAEWGAIRAKIGPNKSDPARCVNTMCAGPRRTGLEFD